MPVPQIMTVKLPCKDEESAALFADYVNTHFGYRPAIVEDRHVTVTTTDRTASGVLYALNQQATAQDWALGPEMELAAADFLDSLARREAD